MTKRNILKNKRKYKTGLSCFLAVILFQFLSGSSYAEVTVYGRLDAGLNFTSTTHRENGIKTRTNSFAFASGQQSQSRWGIKGKEDLGGGYSIGFVLEQGFDLDSGAAKSNGYRAWHRDSLLYLVTPYGELGMGRSGTVNSKSGRYGLMKDDLFPLDNGWGPVADTEIVFAGQHSRVDNLITYRTPRFAGFQVTLQHSTKQEAAIPSKMDAGEDGTSDTTRFWGIGAKYSSGNLTSMLAVSVDTIGHAVEKKRGNAKTATFAISYDFGAIWPMFGIQYFDTALQGKPKGSAIVTGFTTPCFGGRFYVQGGWMMDTKAVGDDDTKFGNWMVGVGYKYNFTKNIWGYAAAGYSLEKKTNKAKSLIEKDEIEVVQAGIVYRW